MNGYSRGNWREYRAELTYRTGVKRTGWVRAVSQADAERRMDARYGLPGVRIGRPEMCQRESAPGAPRTELS